MPILKTDILGSSLEINYDENELEKLNKLIKNFKKKINKYPNKDRIGKFSLIFLLAIKLEDQIYELEKLLQISKENTNNDKKLIENNNLEINDILKKYEDGLSIINKQNSDIEKFENNIKSLKNDLDIANNKNLNNTDLTQKALSEIENLDSNVKSLKLKISSFLKL